MYLNTLPIIDEFQNTVKTTFNHFVCPESSYLLNCLINYFIFWIIIRLTVLKIGNRKFRVVPKVTAKLKFLNFYNYIYN